METMGLNTDNLDTLVSGLEDMENGVMQLKTNIRDALLSDLEESFSQGLLTINWEAIRKRRYLRR